MRITEGERTGGVDEEQDFTKETVELGTTAVDDFNEFKFNSGSGASIEDGRFGFSPGRSQAQFGSTPIDKQSSAKVEPTGKRTDSKKPKGLIRESVGSNELEQFTSMNYMFGLYCLTTEEILDPDNTYMNGNSEPEVVVIKSGGGTRNLGARKAMTSLEKEGGRVEYYIDGLDIDSIIGYNSTTRAVQLHRGGFKVIEPYSMGQFLEALQVAANMAGHHSYTLATFLISVEFVGYTGDNQTVRAAKRMMPVQLTEAGMTVDGSGTTYELTFISAGASANTNSVQQLQTDVQLVGNDLQEVLQSGEQSLTAILNSTLMKREEGNANEYADQYIILFPPKNALQSAKARRSSEIQINELNSDNEAVDDMSGFLEKISGVETIKIQSGKGVQAQLAQSLKEDEMNAIGRSKLVSTALQSGEVQPLPMDQMYDPIKKTYELKLNTIPADKRAFKFEKGTKINNIIEELVLMSEYGKQMLESKQVAGYRDWFSISTMVFQVPIDGIEQRKGRPPFIYIFKVIPYAVHASTWMAPGDIAPEAPINDIAREYNYLYTGKNKNVLNFDLTFNARFLTPIPRDQAGDTSTAQNAGDSATANEEDTSNKIVAKEGNEDKPIVPLKSTLESDIEIITSGMRAVPSDTKEVIARTFHKALVNSGVDLVEVQLEIMGDPYFLSDSGTGNYQSAEGSTWYQDADGQIDHVRAQQFVRLNFKTPYDYSSSSSTIEFPTVQSETDGVTVRQFSGLYKVNEVKHTFDSGKFTQMLTLLRMNNQAELDYKNKQAGEKVGASLEGGADKTTTLTNSSQSSRGMQI